MENTQTTWNNETFQKAVKFLLAKTFDLREGEYKRAFLMQLNIFLIISTLLVIKPTVNGLFISNFGVKSLPLAFVLVAICATAFSVFYSKKLIHIPLHLLIRRTLIISVISLAVFGILLSFNFLSGWVIYLLYIWVAIFAVLSASQFWILANLVFNSREAKRLFGFIGAGAIAGGIFGGYLTSILASSIGTEKLLFVSAFILFFCIPITQTIWRENISGKNTNTARTLPKGIDENPFQLIRKSKHLTYLAGIVGVSVIVAKLVDYQFNAIASHKIHDPDELTAFFGFWFSNFNLISLMIQLFLTRKVVGVFGVGTSLFVLPGAIFLGAVLVLFAPSLFAAIFIKMADGSLKQSINKSSVELLALPIPLEIKNKTKTFIDVFVDSVATGIGGLILILLVNAFQLSTNFISLIILVVLGIWFYFAMQVRKEYIQSFHQKIKQNGEHASNTKKAATTDSILNGLIRVFKTGTDKQIIWVLQKSLEAPNDKLFTHLVQLLEHPNEEIRSEALRNLYFYRNKNILEKVLQLITDPDQTVKVRAFEYLMTHDPENRTKLMNRYLYDKDIYISGAALLSLASEARDNPELKRQYELRRIIAYKIDHLGTENDPEIINSTTKIILEAIGKGSIVSYFGFIEKALNHQNPEIVNAAIGAAGLSMSSEFIDQLIQLIPSQNYFNSVSKALTQYGVEILPFFESLFALENQLETLRKIPSIVANIESQKSVQFLFNLMNSEDFQIRNEALLSLNVLKTKFPFLHFDKKLVINKIFEEVKIIQDTLSILYIQTQIEKNDQNDAVTEAKNLQIAEARKSLIVLLERRLDGGLDRIFKLLGLKYPPDQISVAFKNFSSTKPDIRLSTIEYLENLLDTRLKRALIPLFETTTLETVSKEVLKNLNIHIPDESECYAMLLDGNDIKIKLAVLYLISQLKGKQYISLATKYLTNPNQKVRDFAQKALTALEKE